MPDKPFLNEYTGQTTDELIGMEGEYRVDSLACAFEQALDQKAARVGVESLSTEERTVLAVMAFEREVNNGGFIQFFFNSSREFAPDLALSLERIDQTEVAALARRAFNVLGVGDPVTVDRIDEVMEVESDETNEKLNELDSEYYDRGYALSDSLFDFIKANRAAIKLTN